MAALIVYAEKTQPGVVSLSYIACQKSPKPNLGNFDMDKVAGKKASKPKDATLKDGADWLLLKGIASRVFSEKSGEVTLESGAKVGKKGTSKHFLFLKDLVQTASTMIPNAASPGGTVSDVVRMQLDQEVLAPMHFNLVQYTKFYSKLIDFKKLKPSEAYSYQTNEQFEQSMGAAAAATAAARAPAAGTDTPTPQGAAAAGADAARAPADANAPMPQGAAAAAIAAVDMAGTPEPVDLQAMLNSRQAQEAADGAMRIRVGQEVEAQFDTGVVINPIFASLSSAPCRMIATGGVRTSFDRKSAKHVLLSVFTPQIHQKTKRQAIFSSVWAVGL